MLEIKKLLNMLLTEEDTINANLRPNDKKYRPVVYISRNFGITEKELNRIFSQLQWAYKKNLWWFATELGLSKGAKECVNNKTKAKYLQWEESVQRDSELIMAINAYKEIQNQRRIIEEKKGVRYEEFVAEHYRELGYFVWEHGKERGHKESGIDLIAKKKKEIIFIQCKNEKQSSDFQLDYQEVKASKTEIRYFVKDNPLFMGYEMKCRYTLSENFIHQSSIQYLEESDGFVDYEVLKMESV